MYFKTIFSPFCKVSPLFSNSFFLPQFKLKLVRNYNVNVTPQPVDLTYILHKNPQTPKSLHSSPLIIKHGLFGSKFNWNSLSKALLYKLVPPREIIAVDCRNHGESPHSISHTYEDLAEDTKVLLNKLNIEKASLLGHSMGGRAVMYFALKYPHLIDKLVVVDISPIQTSASLGSMTSLFNTMQEVKFPTGIPMSQVRQEVDKQLANKIQDKDLRAFILTNLTQKPDGSFNWRVNLPTLINTFTKNIFNFPKVIESQFHGPVLFVGGGESDYLKKADHPEIKKIFPNAEFKYIEGAGHWLHSEKPNEFLKICVEFLNRIDS